MFWAIPCTRKYINQCCNSLSKQAIWFYNVVSPAPQGVDGNFYVHNEWNRADIFMTDSTKLSDLNIKIDLKSNNIEIEYNTAVKLLPVNRVLAVKLTQAGDPEEYINGSTLGGAEMFTKSIFAGAVSGYCHVAL
jgi:hypothetical protein